MNKLIQWQYIYLFILQFYYLLFNIILILKMYNEIIHIFNNVFRFQT